MTEHRKEVAESSRDEAGPPPPRPRILTMDSTIEKFQRLLAVHPRGLLTFRDELSGLVGGFGRFKKGDDSEKGFYLEGWNARKFTVDRIKDGEELISIQRAFVAILGGIVPDNLHAILSQSNDGFAARFLFVWPRPAPIVDIVFDVEWESSKRNKMLKKGFERLRRLAMLGDDDELKPLHIKLGEGAQSAFNLFRRQYVKAARATSGTMAGWHGKNPGRVMRLALIYELLSWSTGDARLEPKEVSLDSLNRAGRYLEYATVMFSRVIASAVISQKTRDAVAIARWLRAEKVDDFTGRQLSKQPGFNSLRDTERRNEALEELVRHGWIRQGPKNVGARSSGNWVVSPEVGRM
jgi:hypothetical protein